MLQLLILIIIIFVVFFSLKIHHEKHSSEIDYVISQLDNHKYLVRNLPDKKQAAELMAQIRTNLIKLVDHLKKKYPHDPRTSRLIEKFNPDNMSESSHDSSYTSYSVNKGEKLIFCLREKDDSHKLTDLNTIMFVAIHELAHIMTKSVGHTKEFWNNMRFLLDVAMSNELRVYHYQPYHNKPQPYCGMTISDTPLKL